MIGKLVMLLGLGLVLSSSPVLAAEISNLSGQTCGDSQGLWHFSNVQTKGAAAGVLTAHWDSGDSCTVGPDKVNSNQQGFTCGASGTLTSASTSLPGRLVFSDVLCSAKCDPDPKTGVCK